MNTLRTFFVGLLFAVFIATPVLAVATPFASSASALQCEQSLAGIPPWFKGLTKEETVAGKTQCVIVGPANTKDGPSIFITKVVLNVIQIALTVIGYIAVFFILLGGFQFLTGGSNPSQIEKARKTILNAVIGLVISIGAVAIVNLVFGILG